jgi:hypothetical protein
MHEIKKIEKSVVLLSNAIKKKNPNSSQTEYITEVLTYFLF